MAESTKIIIAVISGFMGAGIIYSIFKFIILNFFKEIGDKFAELFGSRNEHETTIKVYEERFENLEKRLDKWEEEHKNNHK